MIILILETKSNIFHTIYNKIGQKGRHLFSDLEFLSCYVHYNVKYEKNNFFFYIVLYKRKTVIRIKSC